MLWISTHRPYSQNFIFFVSEGRCQWASEFQYTLAETLVSEKHSSLLGPFVSYEENEVLWIRTQRPYFQNFSFFVTEERSRWASEFHHTRAERLVSEKHSSLLSPFVSYKENEVLWIQTQGLYLQNFIFFVTEERSWWASELHHTPAETLVREKHSSLLSPFVSYEENELLCIWTEYYIF